MTHRRRLLLSLVLLVALAVAGVGVVAWLAGPKHRINRESLSQIQRGMTLQEVKDLLGGPPGDYSRSALVVRYWPGPQWIGEDFAIQVWFDRQGRVYAATEITPSRYSVSILDKIRHRLGL
jgi:hypothetical protein